MRKIKDKLPGKIVLLVAIISMSFSSIIVLNAEERCELVGYYDGDYKE